MVEDQYGWNSKIASKSNMAAIIKCQLIQENNIIAWRQYQGNSYDPSWLRIHGHTTTIRVLQHSRLSNPANQEALTLLYKENISHGIQKSD